MYIFIYSCKDIGSETPRVFYYGIFIPWNCTTHDTWLLVTFPEFSFKRDWKRTRGQRVRKEVSSLSFVGLKGKGSIQYLWPSGEGVSFRILDVFNERGKRKLMGVRSPLVGVWVLLSYDVSLRFFSDVPIRNDRRSGLT